MRVSHEVDEDSHVVAGADDVGRGNDPLSHGSVAAWAIGATTLSVASVALVVVLGTNVLGTMRSRAASAMSTTPIVALADESSSDSSSSSGSSGMDASASESASTDTGSSASSSDDGSSSAGADTGTSASTSDDGSSSVDAGTSSGAGVDAGTSTSGTVVLGVGDTGHTVVAPRSSKTGDVVTDDTGREYSVYVVTSADTLSGISMATDRSVDALARVNGIVNVNLIYDGSILLIPLSTDGSY